MNKWLQSLELIRVKLSSWGDSLILSLPNLVLVLLILIVGIWTIRLAKGQIRKLSRRVSSNVALQNLLFSVSKVILYIALFILILSVLGLQKSVTTILASAGVMGLAVGLALQDPLMNFFSGVIMSVKTSFKIGDVIETNGHKGEVIAISLKDTIVRALTGEEVSIPNKMVLQNPVINFSTNGLRRINIDCGVTYGANLRKVKEVATLSVVTLADQKVAIPVEFIFMEFGDSSIDFQLRFWVRTNTISQFLELKSEGIMKLKEAFDNEGISIPFPIRTLDFNPNKIHLKDFLN